jgi:hypothetical protein
MMTEIRVHPRDENERYMRRIYGPFAVRLTDGELLIEQSGVLLLELQVARAPSREHIRHGRRTFWTTVVSASVSEQYHV